VAAPDGFTAESVVEAAVNRPDLGDIEPDERKALGYRADTGRVKLRSAVGVDAMFAVSCAETKALRTRAVLVCFCVATVVALAVALVDLARPKLRREGLKRKLKECRKRLEICSGEDTDPGSPCTGPVSEVQPGPA
jgi:hypothetical protein